MFKIVQHSFFLIACCCCFNLTAQAPANDNCADAIAIDTGEYAFSTVDATTDGPAHPDDCASAGATPDSTYNDIWYSFTADFTGFAIFSTCSTANYDSKIIVYNDGVTCPPGTGDVLACNEDGPGCTLSTSQVIFNVTSGSTYLLRVGGYGDGSPGLEGFGTFLVQQYIPSGPPNDFCADAVDLDLGAEDSIVVSYTNIDALSDGPIHGLQSCFDPGEPEVFNNVWYRFTPDFTGWMEWTNCGTAGYDSRVAIYASTACPPTTETLVGCSDDGIDELGINCPGYTSRAIFPVESGVTYSISVGGWSAGDAGNGAFTLKRVNMPDFPANDNCATPDSVFIITKDQADGFDFIFPGNTLYATWDDTQIRPTCRPTGEHWDVWYRFNSGENTEIELRLNRINGTSQYVIDLYSACGQPDTSAAAYCKRTDEIPSTVAVDTLVGFPGVPTEYLLRVTTRVTAQEPGPFWIQLVGTPYVPPSGVEEPLFGSFSFAPNPATDRATLQFDLRETSPSSNWSIVNTLGQVVQKQNLGRLDAGHHALKLPLENLNGGVYFLCLETEQGQRTVRFVKQ